MPLKRNTHETRIRTHCCHEPQPITATQPILPPRNEGSVCTKSVAVVTVPHAADDENIHTYKSICQNHSPVSLVFEFMSIISGSVFEGQLCSLSILSKTTRTATTARPSALF